MGILLVISSFSGGSGRILANIVENSPSTVKFDAIALADVSEAGLIRVLNQRTSFIHALNKKFGIDSKTYLEFKKAVDRLAPQLAISFDFASNIYTCAALKGKRIAWIASVHGLESAFVPWRRWIEKIAFAFAKKVVVPSLAVKDKLICYKIVPSHKIEVIPNGTSLQTNLREIGLRSGQKTIGCVANFYSEVKGHRYAIDALKDLPQDFRLIMVGDGILKGDMVSHAENIGVKDRVTFLGHKSHDEIFDELRKMDVLVIPSLSESFGLVAIEAMSVGLPVVASRVGGLKTVVDDGVSGKLAPSCNPKMLAHAIEEVLSDQDKYVAMQHACLKRVKEHYSVEAMTNEYFELFDKVLP